MQSTYKQLGKYIQPVDIRNKDLAIDRLLGVSVKKVFIPSIANTVGTDFSKYKIVKKNQFTYIADTSRRGDKIGLAMLEDYDEALVSQAYTVFEVIDTEELDPEYLMMWFRRPEFDRYARFMSHGSVREIFDWEEMCEVSLPIPSIEKQRAIVKEYNTVVNRIKLNEQLNQKLEETAQALYKHWFVDFEFPYSPPLEGCPQDGVVNKAQLITTPDKATKIRNTKNYKSLPYNPKLKERAKALRKAGNLAEVLFWKEVRNKQFLGLDFDRQKIIGNYIVDFYCANTQTVIEIDGSSHDNKQDYDAARDEYLKSLGITVIHIADTDVKKHLGQTMRWLKEHATFLTPKLKDNGGSYADAKLPPRLSGTPPTEGNLTKPYKSSGGKMVYNAELEKEIPEGWEVEPLENIATLKYGKMLDSSLFQDFGYPVFSGYGIRGYYEKYMYEETQILVLCRGVSGTGEVRLSPPKAYITNLSIVVEIRKNITSKMYLYYHLKNSDLRSLDSGSAQSMITTGDLNFYKTLAPPINYQKKFDTIVMAQRKQLDVMVKEDLKLNILKNLLLSKMTQVKPVKEMAV